jgi:hypothetical protein
MLLHASMSVLLILAFARRCQPWTIIGTGLACIGFVNLISQGSLLWTVLAGIPITAWWLLFLVLYPAQFKQYVEEQRSFQQLDNE